MAIEVFFQHDFAILEQDKGLGIRVFKMLIKAVDALRAPTETGWTQGIPLLTGQWRKIQLCFCRKLGKAEKEDEKEG